jgi:DNA-binding transcriptional regulator GbsR (MarR family)
MPCIPITRNAIARLLQEEGPLTAAEITEALQFNRKRVDASIVEARKKYGTDIFRIAGYKRQVGVGGREAPIYAVGPGQDARRPKMNTAEDKKKIQERYREKHKYILRLRTHKRRHGEINPFFLALGITS